MGIFNGIEDIASKIGSTVLKAESKIGEATINTAKAGYKIATNTPFSDETKLGKFGNYVADPIGRHANNVKGFVTGLVKENPETIKWNEKKGALETKGGGYKLGKLGWAAVAGMMAYNGISDTAQTLETNNLGPKPSEMGEFTPRTPSYANNGGADGSLVFALNANRRG